MTERKEERMKVVASKKINYNVVHFTLQSNKALPEMPVSSFVYIYNTEGIRKPYTPTEKTNNTLEFYVKMYPDGKVSTYLYNLKAGDIVTVEYFIDKLEYLPNKHSSVLFLAGGTGITPCLQVIDQILYNKRDKTKICLFNYNHTEKDNFTIERQKRYEGNSQIKIFNIFTEKQQFLEQKIEIPEGYDFVYVCGPIGFMKTVSGPKTVDKKQGPLLGILKEKYYTSEQVYKF